jgi:hypothetical protein
MEIGVQEVFRDPLAQLSKDAIQIRKIVRSVGGGANINLRQWLVVGLLPRASSITAGSSYCTVVHGQDQSSSCAIPVESTQ